MVNSLNKEFTVKITRAIPENETGTYTYTFRCGNIPYNNPSDNISGSLYRVEVNIQEAGGVFKDTCNVAIYGLSIESLNAICFTWWDAIRKVDTRNKVEIIVDDTVIFQGDTYFISADFSNTPDVCLRITGVVGYAISSIMLPNKDYTGWYISNAFEDLGKQVGMKVLISQNVTGICPRLVLSGSLENRIKTIGKALNLDVNLTCGYIIVKKHDEAMPMFKGASGTTATPTTVINKDTGMIGYPSFNNFGVNFSTIFDPYIKTSQVVRIESIVPKVTGEYIIISKQSLLSSLPNGQWRSNYVATSLKVKGEN